MKAPDVLWHYATAVAGEYGGGVELGFMSTTTSEQNALEFSGGEEAGGTIVEISITSDSSSRGADISHFSFW